MAIDCYKCQLALTQEHPCPPHLPPPLPPNHPPAVALENEQDVAHGHGSPPRVLRDDANVLDDAAQEAAKTGLGTGVEIKADPLHARPPGQPPDGCLAHGRGLECQATDPLAMSKGLWVELATRHGGRGARRGRPIPFQRKHVEFSNGHAQEAELQVTRRVRQNID